MNSHRPLPVLATIASFYAQQPLWAQELLHHKQRLAKKPDPAVQSAAEAKRARKAAKRAKDAGYGR